MMAQGNAMEGRDVGYVQGSLFDQHGEKEGAGGAKP